MIDTHVHMSQVAAGEAEQQLDEARRLGTKLFVEVGTTVENSRRVLEFVQGRDDFYCGVAVHPWQVDSYSEASLPALPVSVQPSTR